MSKSDVDLATMVYGPAAEEADHQKIEGIIKAFLEPIPAKQLTQWGLKSTDDSAMAVFSTFRYEGEPEGTYAAVELMRPLSPENTGAKLVVGRDNSFRNFMFSSEEALVQTQFIARELLSGGEAIEDARQQRLIAHMGYLGFCQLRGVVLSDEAKTNIQPLKSAESDTPAGDLIRAIVDPNKAPRQDIRVFAKTLEPTHRLVIGDYHFVGDGLVVPSAPLYSVDYADLEDKIVHRYRRAHDGSSNYKVTPIDTPRVYIPPEDGAMEFRLEARAVDLSVLTARLFKAALECNVDLSSIDK